MSLDVAEERQQWAVDLMKVRPEDRILEIGCGPGVAASLVCDRLKNGYLLAVDRSTAMIAKALVKNKVHVDRGVAEFRQGSFSEIEKTVDPFDKIFSFNVNLFWLKPDEDLPILRQILDARGKAFFFYTPPDAVQMRKIKTRLPQCLEAHHFKVMETFETKFGSTAAYGLKARV